MDIRRFILFLFAATHILYMAAQDLNGIKLSGSNTSVATSLVQPGFNLSDSIRIISSDFTGGMMPGSAFHNGTFRLNPLNQDFSTSGVISSWEGGAIYGASHFSALPALGNLRSASAVFDQKIGKFTFSAAIYGSKYHFDNSIYNDFGVSGKFSYRMNDKLTFNVFGNYSRNNVFHSAAALPYTSQSGYGASVTYSPSDKFSIEAGVRRRYDPMSGRWELVPIVAPAVNLNGAKVSADFGGLIYDIIHSATSGDIRHSNPTIAPPKAPIPVR